jgi:hypothetical protein
MQQSQTSSGRGKTGKGSGIKKYNVGGGNQHNFVAKRGNKRMSSQRGGGRGGSFTGRTVSNGGRKVAGLVRPMTGKNRF